MAVLLYGLTRCILRWEQGRSPDHGLRLAALRRATRGPTSRPAPLRPGVQYADTAYTGLPTGRGMAIRMAAVGKPEESGHAERRIRTRGEGEVDLSECPNFIDAYRHLGRFRDDLDNRKPIHSAPGDMPTAEFEWP